MSCYLLCFLKAKTSLHQLNSKNNVTLLSFETLYRNFFLSNIAMDWHRLKLEKVGPTISSFNAMPTKITKNYYIKCPPMKFVWYHLHNPTGAFCVKAKAVINDFSIDCKTVIFFLKISKEMGKAWRKSQSASLTCPLAVLLASLPGLALGFHPRCRPFVWLLQHTWIRKNTDCFSV